jgi:hypothetical protein
LVRITEMKIDYDTFKSLARPLIGMTISRPWRGYGSAVFLELGVLSTRVFKGRESKSGEVCIDIQWDWRIENDLEVICGSSNSAPRIQSHLSELLGLSIIEIGLCGVPPELTLHFSNGSRLRSMSMVTGDPQWAIRLKDSTWLSCRQGALVADDGSGGQGFTDEEREVSERATEATKRWAKPSLEPIRGECRDCCHFVRLDGDFELLDYGACASPLSPFDGRVTNRASGCPAFSAKT